MYITDWFRGLFNLHDGTLPLDAYVGNVVGEVFYKELALQASVNLIANTITRSEFLTYEKGKEVKNDNYYLLNIEPNQNKSASKFWRDVIHKLIYDNECLVIQQDKMFYVADSFNPVKFAFKENIYKNIVVEGYNLKNVYTESQVFHFELHNQRIKTVIDNLCESYSKLIKASSKGYLKGKGKKAKLTIPTNYPQTEKAQEDLKKLLEERFKTFFEAEGDAVLPLTNGLGYEEIGQDNKTQSSSIEGRHIRAFVDDIFDFTAIGLQIPPALLKGNVADTGKAVNDFLTFCINPLAKILSDEINRKLYGKKLYLERTYCKLDTTRIKVVELKDIANALDILTRIGAYCVDDSLRALGMEPLNTEWSKARWMTKNYSPIEKMAKGDG
ncbi:phage portal protein [Sedimentibacter hydroxybenzoicus DSM 7310]|uniref:Phage portal protein n=1 Tax=Sedimentibacter hydroxybenzoicus DSM 7310 TaxID=1123245 RepID=A0A974BJE5_SEDHY|nr:phage portal protein [Sedimentibacter hydroxybenzoicus]NYB73862.1 phage portal protein [Sedimentibacter hydroxybenzoicus DSM 7310]